jgi:hypothetical protein
VKRHRYIVSAAYSGYPVIECLSCIHWMAVWEGGPVYLDDLIRVAEQHESANHHDSSGADQA